MNCVKKSISFQSVSLRTAFDSVGVSWVKVLHQDVIRSMPSNLDCDLMWLSVARWCVVNEKEMAKCEALVEATKEHSRRGLETLIGAWTYTYDAMPTLKCVMGTDQYDCMSKIFTNEADLIELGTGLSYTAGEYYNMIPLVAEKYVAGSWHSVCDMRSIMLNLELPTNQWYGECCIPFFKRLPGNSVMVLKKRRVVQKPILMGSNL